MVFEHFALNVANPQEIKNWYVANLGMKVVKEMDRPPFMTFLADATDRVVCELYSQPKEKMTDFSGQHPLTFHFAFESTNAQADCNRLQQAGASFVEEVKKEDGSHLVMLRDPWGIPLQLCQRAIRLNR